MEDSRFLRKYRSEECLNCGAHIDVSDKYCFKCGQLNTTKRLTFNDFFAEFFQNIIIVDSKFRTTLKDLLFKPGTISKRYIEGERMKYANPFRFYLSASIILFILIGLGASWEDSSKIYKEEAHIEELGFDFKEAAKSPYVLDSLVKASERDSTSLIKSLKSNFRRKADTSYLKEYYTQREMDSMGFFDRTWKKAVLYNKFYEDSNIINAKVALDSLNHEYSYTNRNIYKKARRFAEFDTNINNLEELKTIVDQLPFLIFFYLPIFALFIKLIYIRRSFTYMEHLVFTFHVQTALFIMLIPSVLFGFIFSVEWIDDIIFLLFMFYLYKALRNFYQQGRIKTILKFMLLSFIFITLAGITFVASLFTMAIFG
ncbi:hypothetical protein GCM10009117_23800 [Gangjinia marincola]|uniref:DUF3667 domain-containing protein n=1 Tax=Gangjinia marincola TaxID=578463 RepID=A0ABN1MJ64_9FLAO